MALDSQDKRASALGFALAFRLVMPVTTGTTFTEAQQAQLAYSYSGVVPVPATFKPIPARVPYSPPQIGETFGAADARTQLALIARAISPSTTRTVVAATTIKATDDLLLCDTTAGGFTVTLLPANQVQWLTITIKNIGTGTVTLSGTVDGTLNPTLAQYKLYTIQSDGAAWWIRASF